MDAFFEFYFAKSSLPIDKIKFKLKNYFANWNSSLNVYLLYRICRERFKIKICFFIYQNYYVSYFRCFLAPPTKYFILFVSRYLSLLSDTLEIIQDLSKCAFCKPCFGKIMPLTIFEILRHFPGITVKYIFFLIRFACHFDRYARNGLPNSNYVFTIVSTPTKHIIWTGPESTNKVSS